MWLHISSSSSGRRSLSHEQGKSSRCQLDDALHQFRMVAQLMQTGKIIK